MNRATLLIYILFLSLSSLKLPAFGQQNSLQQNIRGIVTDAESKLPLAGVTVITLSNNQLNDISDSNGYFTIKGVPVGRQSFQFSYMGYAPRIVSEILVTSGKEPELNISLTENMQQLKEVSISASGNKTRALNEFATVSARSFSVEETKRYAASVSDPARMAMNFMGVSGQHDGENGIIVRGNSPRGILWRLDGIEIPSPNHFGSLSASGGAVSMLNASMLGTSDFYTGAFPAEIGNALSGAFDLNFRNGNTNRAEHALQIGTLGAEVATEGPFKKGGKSSYIANYRYSTLKLLLRYFDLGGVLPEYQDASFKLNFPTNKAGTFTVFGLGGYNRAYKDPVPDSSLWTNSNPNFVLDGYGWLGVAGISHQYFLNPHAYVKTIISTSYDRATTDADTLNPQDGYARVPTQTSAFINTAYRLSVLYNNKINSNQTLRMGIITQQLDYDLKQRILSNAKIDWDTVMNGSGGTQYYQAYLQWKARVGRRLTVITGLHSSYYALNKRYSIEPRASASYNAGKNIITLAAGLHTKPESIAVHYLKNSFKNGIGDTLGPYPNANLDLLRAVHIVAGYERPLPFKLRLKTELYFQYLYHIPVEQYTGSTFSILNTENIYALNNIRPLVSTGTGRNYGIDVSIERPFTNNFYVLGTGSLFKSEYTTYSDETFNTQFNRSFQVNILGGKEITLRKNGRTILGLNGKWLCSGGLREGKIDIAASRANNTTIFYPGSAYSIQGKPYSRTDVTLYLKFNRARATHSIQLDGQNIFNRSNYFYSYFDNNSGTVKSFDQTGIIPNIAYRVEFH